MKYNLFSATVFLFVVLISEGCRKKKTEANNPRYQYTAKVAGLNHWKGVLNTRSTFVDGAGQVHTSYGTTVVDTSFALEIINDSTLLGQRNNLVLDSIDAQNNVVYYVNTHDALLYYSGDYEIVAYYAANDSATYQRAESGANPEKHWILNSR